MVRRHEVLGLFALAGVAACGGGDGGGQTIDCELLTSEQNCWHEFLADVADCVPPETEEGALSGDRTSCTYDSGYRVEFDPAAPSPWIGEGEETAGRSYTVLDGDAVCFDWQDTGSSTQISSPTATITLTASGSGGATITCPDGTRYVTSGWQALVTECGYDAFTRGFPTEVLLESGDGFGVELTYAEEQDVRAFWCRK